MIRNRATVTMLPCNKWFVRLPTRKQSDTIASAVLGGTVQLTHPGPNTQSRQHVTNTRGARHQRLNGDYRCMLWVPSPPHRTTGTRAYIMASTMRARGVVSPGRCFHHRASPSSDCTTCNWAKKLSAIHGPVAVFLPSPCYQRSPRGGAPRRSPKSFFTIDR